MFCASLEIMGFARVLIAHSRAIALGRLMRFSSEQTNQLGTYLGEKGANCEWWFLIYSWLSMIVDAGS